LKVIFQEHPLGTKDYTVLLKISKVYFFLNKLSPAVAMINKAYNLAPTDQTCLLWKGIIYYYYISSKAQFADTPRMSD